MVQDPYGPHGTAWVHAETLSCWTKLVAGRNSLSLPTSPFLQHLSRCFPVTTLVRGKPWWLSLWAYLSTSLHLDSHLIYVWQKSLMKQFKWGVCISANQFYQHDIQVSPIYLLLIVCCFLKNKLYISHMDCDLALSKENAKEGFLVDCKLFFSVFHHPNHRHLQSLKFGSRFLTVTTLRALFVLLDSTNDSDFERGHRWIKFRILC